jgi:hypothetical protein
LCSGYIQHLIWLCVVPSRLVLSLHRPSANSVSRWILFINESDGLHKMSCWLYVCCGKHSSQIMRLWLLPTRIILGFNMPAWIRLRSRHYNGTSALCRRHLQGCFIINLHKLPKRIHVRRSKVTCRSHSRLLLSRWLE